MRVFEIGSRTYLKNDCKGLKPLGSFSFVILPDLKVGPILLLRIPHSGILKSGRATPFGEAIPLG